MVSKCQIIANILLSIKFNVYTWSVTGQIMNKRKHDDCICKYRSSITLVYLFIPVGFKRILNGLSINSSLIRVSIRTDLITRQESVKNMLKTDVYRDTNHRL